MRSYNRLRVFFIVIIVSCFCSSIVIGQEDTKNPFLEQGIGQYKHENYEEALPLLKKARKEDPTSTLASYYLGLNYKQLQKYRQSIGHLRHSVTTPPKIIGALVELIDALYSVGELEEAHKWIIEAENEGIRPAQVSFLKGLVLLKEDKLEESIESFERAKDLDKLMGQACDYQIGIAHLKAREYDYARKAFKEVITLDPASNTAQYANEYIDALTRKEEAERPWKLYFNIAWQYDDNVVLKPNDGSIATNITETEDWRTVYTARADYNHRFNEKYSLKGQYAFYFSKQNDLGFYDTMSNTVVFQPQIHFTKSLVSFPFSYTHSMVNERSYLSNPSVGTSCNYMVNASNMAQISGKYGNKNYLWTPSNDDEDRDSDELSADFGWYRFFAKKKGFVNLKYGVNREWTEGNNWYYVGNRVNATVLLPLLDELNLTISAGTRFQNYRKSHTVYNVKRKDRIHTITSLLAYKFHKNSELQAQYTYVKDESNISVYEYDRNIYSVGVQCKF